MTPEQKARCEELLRKGPNANAEERDELRTLMALEETPFITPLETIEE